MSKSEKSLENLWRNVRVVADLSRLPVEINLKQSKFQTFFLIIFGVVWLAITSGFLAPMIFGGGASEPIIWVFIIIFPLIGLGLILGGLYQLTVRRTLNITRTRVSFGERTPLGRRNWQEPLSAYKGIRHYTRVIKSKNSSTTYQIVELAHQNPARAVPLFVQPGMKMPRQKIEDYASALELSVMGGTGQAARHADDLDKSIRELSAEGKFENRFDPNSPIPPTLKILTSGSGEDAELKITILAPRIPRALQFAMIIIPVLFGGVASLGNNSLIPLGIGLVVLVAAILAILRDRRTPRIVRINRNSITGEAGLAGGKTPPKTIPFGSVEEVYVRRDANGRGQNIVVAGDHATIAIGAGLPAKSLEWLRGYIAAAILTA